MSGAGKSLLVLLVAVGLVLPTAALPAAAAADAGTLSNDEVALADLDPSGLPVQAELVSRITSTGGTVREVLDPSSTTNVSYRDRRGSPQTAQGGVLVEVGGPGTHTVLTQAVFDKPLPVALHASYTLDGAVVPPEQVLGRAGELGVTYTITNTTAQQQTIAWTDADGVRRTQEVPVFVPFAGTLLVTLPLDADLLAAPGAVQATDLQGATLLRYDLLLAPPAGSFQAQFAVRMRTEHAATPAVVLTLAPATAQNDPALDFAAGLLDTSTAAAAEGVGGLRDVDTQTANLARGAAQLADGAVQVASGQQQLAAGVAAGAEGAAAVAAAATVLRDGFGQVAHGLAVLAGPQGLPASAAAAAQLQQAAVLLADLVGSASDGPWRPLVVWPGALPPLQGLPAWPAALEQLPSLLQRARFVPDGRPRDGVCRLDANEDGVLDTPITDLDCIPTLVQTLRLVTGAASAAAQAAAAIPARLQSAGTALGRASGAADGAAQQAEAAAAGADDLLTEVCGPSPVLTSAQCEALAGVQRDAAGATAAAEQASGDIGSARRDLAEAALPAAGLAVGLPVLVAALRAATGLAEAAGAGLRSGNPTAPGLVEALGALQGGLAQAASGAQALSSGAALAVQGSDRLATATEQLSRGLGLADAGAGQLASASGKVSDGAQTLAGGAEQLQSQGTSAALAAAVAASAKSAQGQAVLQAVDARAADALPYGAPEGAQGHAAYVFTMPATTAGGGAPGWGAAILAALLAAGVAAALLRRRGSGQAEAA